jgi:hypothetical protein
MLFDQKIDGMAASRNENVIFPARRKEHRIPFFTIVPHRRLFDIRKAKLEQSFLHRGNEVPGKAAKNEGASEAMTSLFFDKSSFAAARSSRMILQDWGQTKKHLPHRTHSSGMIEACPLRNEMDFVGQLRMHL